MKTTRTTRQARLFAAASFAAVTLCGPARAATTVSGDFPIDHTLTTEERPLIITGDANITVAAGVTTSLGALTNNGYTVTINLESGSKAGLAWLTARGNGTTTINFNGGALTDGGGWDTPWFDTASGSIIALVSVDGNPIRVTHPLSQRKYWNRNRDGAAVGRVTTSGSGRCDLLSANLSNTTKLTLTLCGCTTTDWGHTGGTYLGHYGEAGLTGYVVCGGANVLPAGDIYLGTANGLSPIELNLSGNSQTVGRIHLQNAWSTVIAGAGTPALKFASANASIDSTCAAAAPVLSVPAITVLSGATLTVDKVAVATTALSNNGTLAYANGGKLTLNLSNAANAIALSATNPASGATAIVKSGAGTYSYAGDAALDIDALTVSAGEFRLSGPRGTTNRWWRFTIKQCESTSTHANISEMRLLDGILTAEGKYQPADGAAPDPDYPSANRYSFSWKNDIPASEFAAYNYNFTYQQGAGTPSYTANGTAHGSGTALSPSVLWMNTATIYGCEFTNPHPKSTDPNTWIAYTYRIADGRAIRGYNLRHAWYFSNYPKYWLLESSADGVTWETMDSQSNYALISTGQSWYNNGGQGDLPNSMIEFGSQVKPTLPTAGGLVSDANIKIASGATFDASLVTGGQEVSALTVDCTAGGGTLKGIRFASTGTLNLQNVPNGTNINEYTVPLTFENVVGTPSLANWTVVATYANGSTREKKLYWDNGVLRVRSTPFTMVVR